MTRSTLRLAVLSLALSSVAFDASAQGLFGWFNRSDETTQSDSASDNATSSTPSRTNSNRSSDSAPTELNAQLAKAKISRTAGDFTEATKILSQLVLFAPDDPRVLGEYGKTLAAQGRSDDALAFLERAIQLQPGEWTFHSALGVAHDQKGEYKEAQAAYGRALQLKPGETAVLNNAALSYMQAGDLDTAERMILQASATSADKGRIEYTLALVQRLKSTRPATTPVQTPVAPAPAPVTPTPAPAAVASLAPAPAPETQILANPAPAEPVIETTPVDSTSLPAPEAVEPIEWDVDITPVAEAPVVEPAPDTSSTTLASLQANPNVVMQAVPKDDLAGPVQSKTQTPAPKAATETPPPARRQLSVSTNPPLTTRTPAPAAPTQTAQAPVPKAEPVVHAYYVQAGAFATEDRADKLASTLNMMGARVSPTTVNGRSLYRVRIGPFKDAQQANDALSVAQSMGHTDVKVVTE